MRAGIGFALAAAAAAAGCNSLGLYEETAKDLSDWNTKAGEELKLDAPHKIRVVKFETDFKTAPGKVKVTLENLGQPEDFLSFDLEFGYPAPSGSIAPYVPDFESMDYPDWKAGEKQEKVYSGNPPVGQKGVPLFARIVTTSGSEVREAASREPSSLGLRPGTTLLGGAVEVVKMDADLTPSAGQKPTLSYTLESMSDTEVGNIRYLVQFYKDGKLLDMGRRFSTFHAVEKPLGKKGDRVQVDVTGLENATGSLAGVKPVLRVIK
jgi:hypothetical protein